MHGGALLAAVIGVPFLSQPPAEPITVAQVELISAADFDSRNSDAPDIMAEDMFSIAAPDMGGDVGDPPDEEVAHENMEQDYVEDPSAKDADPDLTALLEQLLQPEVVVEVDEIDEASADPLGGMAMATMPGGGSETSLPTSPARPGGLAPRQSPSPAFAPPALPKSATTSDRSEDEPPKEVPAEEETPVAEEEPAEEETPVDEGNLIATSTGPVVRPRDFAKQLAAAETAAQEAEEARLADAEAAAEREKQREAERLQAEAAKLEAERQKQEAENIERLLAEADAAAAAEREGQTASAAEETAPEGTAELNVSAESDPSRPKGPPLSQAEIEGLRIAVQKCWIQPTGLSETADLRVVIGVELDPNGTLAGRPTLVEPSRVTSPEMQVVLESGTRAIIRCSGDGYNLPRDKYDQWKYLELEFNPRGLFGS